MTLKNRKIAVTIIAAVLSLITAWAAWGFCYWEIRLFRQPDVSPDSGPFGIIAVASQILVCGTSLLFLTAVQLILPPVVWGIFCYNAFRKNPTAQPEELSYAWKVYIVSNAVTLAIALVIMLVYSINVWNGIGSSPFNALWLCWQEPLFMWAVYIRKMKKAPL